jgi:hypothetical protein
MATLIVADSYGNKRIEVEADTGATYPTRLLIEFRRDRPHEVIYGELQGDNHIIATWGNDDFPRFSINGVGYNLQPDVPTEHHKPSPAPALAPMLPPPTAT